MPACQALTGLGPSATIDRFLSGKADEAASDQHDGGSRRRNHRGGGRGLRGRGLAVLQSSFPHADRERAKHGPVAGRDHAGRARAPDDGERSHPDRGHGAELRKRAPGHERDAARPRRVRSVREPAGHRRERARPALGDLSGLPPPAPGAAGLQPGDRDRRREHPAHGRSLPQPQGLPPVPRPAATRSTAS